MSKITFVILVLLQFLCLQLELSAQSRAKGAKRMALSVSGRVTFKGEPMSGVTVSIRPERMMDSRDPNLILRARTDQKGRYRIAGMAAGRYYISASAPGFGTIVDPPDTIFTIAEGENIGNIDIELRRGAVITGRITDSNNRPLVDEPVELMRFFPDSRPGALHINYSEMGATDDRGVYRFYGLTAGRYLVSVGVSPAGGVVGLRSASPRLFRTFHPNVTDQSKAKVIEVGEGLEVTGIDIAVVGAGKSYNVYGRIVSAENGEPVMGCEPVYGYISEDGRNISRWGLPAGRSNEKGEFRLQGLLPGKFVIFARTDRESEFFSEEEVCEIKDGDLHGVEIRMRQGNSISGVVVIEGTNDQALLSKIPQLDLTAFTWARQSKIPDSRPVKINADHSFRIEGLRPSRVSVALSSSWEYQGFSIMRVERDGDPVSRNDWIEIGSGESVSNVRLVVGYSNSAIHGEVKIVGGKLPSSMRLLVEAHNLNAPQRIPSSAEADVRGQFVIKNLPPGEYELRLSTIYGHELPDERLLTAISQVKPKVVVGRDSNPTVSLEINLTQRKEGR